jgi:hypothetical protein
MEEQDMFNTDTVNPFYRYVLPQINFQTILLEDNEIFVALENEPIMLIPANPGTHIPESMFDYMQSNFFQYLCTNSGTAGNPKE